MGMPKYDRLLYILNLLRSRKNLNAEKIALECGVTERSIYRDIISLSEANIPIYYDNGYKLASENFLPPLNFTSEEYQFLKLALDSSPLNKTDKFKEIYKTLKAKLEAVLSKQVRQKLKFSPETTIVNIKSSSNQLKFFAIIEKAIEENLKLRIIYNSVNSGENIRTIDPYFIIFKGRSFYFVAFCYKRNEFRTFRIDRLAKVEILDEIFIKNNNIYAESYFKDSWEIYAGEPVEIIIKFHGKAAKVVKFGKHHPNEIIEIQNNDTILYKVVTRGTEEIQRWILGFGDEAEVISPENLKRSLRTIGEYLKETY